MDNLSDFIAWIDAALKTSALGMPAPSLVHEKAVEASSDRRSIRIAELQIEGANIEQLAKNVVARRLGSRPEEVTPSEHLRQEYLVLLDGPF